MDLIDIAGNYFFPLVLSIYLLWRLDHFFSEIVKNQKQFQEHVVREIVQVKQELRDLRLEFAKKS